MKFYDTQGREHKVDLRPSRWPRREVGEGRGKFQSQVGEIFQELYPNDHILEEFPCLGERLYLDFFLPRKLMAIEVHGEQHYKYNPFFHGTRADFVRQQNNDKRKSSWCKLNGIRLIIIDCGEEEEKIRKSLS